jgi:hypothetical protein
MNLLNRKKINRKINNKINKSHKLNNNIHNNNFILPKILYSNQAIIYIKLIIINTIIKINYIKVICLSLIIHTFNNKLANLA